MFNPAAVALASGLATQAPDGSVVFTAAPDGDGGTGAVQRTSSEPADDAPAPAWAAPTSAPAVQRLDESVATPAPVPSPPASGGAAALPTDLDELSRQLYDRLSARLREELWLDRERAGLLADLGR